MKSLLSLLAVVLLLSACKKDVDKDPIIPDPEPETPAVYLPLTHGSYWVYDHYRIDTTGEETFQNKSDSIVIQRDSVVNGVTYAVLEGIQAMQGNSWKVFSLLRDSADCVINERGIPLFASENYVDTLYADALTHPTTFDTIYTAYYMMSTTPESAEVPAGTFDVINSLGVITSYMMENPYQIENPRQMPRLYAENVGLVLDTYFFLNAPFRYERRLIRYEIGEKE
jgi:hypothetical protein